MVLADLGRRISGAMQDLTRSGEVDDKAVEALVKEVCSALLESDVNVMLVSSLRKRIQSKINVKDLPASANKTRIVQKTIFDELVALVDPKIEPFRPRKGRANVIMFVGLQGSGKTTSCTKLALYYQRRGFKSCLVCADTFRAGAFDQLKQNATKAKIPFYGSYTETDPVEIAREGVEKFKKEKFEVIIVDTSGRHRQEEDLFAEMVQIQEAVLPQQTIMVLDASIGQAAEDQAKAFKESANFGSVIITKMDGHAKGGGALSAVAATQTPIVFIGTGEHIHDIESFVPTSFISKLLGMGDLQGLMEHVQTMQLDKNKDTLKNLEQGVFTVKDLRDQLSNIMKMGPLSKMAAMIPGMSQLVGEGGDEEGAFRMKRMIYITDSMTAKELSSDGSIFVEQPSRITRVARGSGTSVREVEETLSQVKMFAQMAKKMGGKSGLMSRMNGAGGAGRGGMPQNPQQMAAMQKRLQSMGMSGAGAGAGPGGMNMGDIMKMAGNMDMGALMSQFGGMFGGGGGGGGMMPGMGASQGSGRGQRGSRGRR